MHMWRRTLLYRRGSIVRNENLRFEKRDDTRESKRSAGVISEACNSNLPVA